MCRTTINNYRNKIIKFRQPIRSAYISDQAALKRYLFTKNHLENKTNFSNVIKTDKSWFLLGRNSRWFSVDKNQITDKGSNAKNYKTYLVIIKGNVNTEIYIDQVIFGSNMIETADKTFGNQIGWKSLLLFMLINYSSK